MASSYFLIGFMTSRRRPSATGGRSQNPSPPGRSPSLPCIACCGFVRNLPPPSLFDYTGPCLASSDIRRRFRRERRFVVTKQHRDAEPGSWISSAVRAPGACTETSSAEPRLVRHSRRIEAQLRGDGDALRAGLPRTLLIALDVTTGPDRPVRSGFSRPSAIASSCDICVRK